MNKIKLHLFLFVALLVSVTGRAQTVTGPGTLCLGTTNTYMGTPVGGTWSTSTTSVATISTATGIATGLTLGVTTFTYTLPSSAYATITVTVMPTPSPGTVSGSPTVCAGATTTWTGSVGGGTWSSSSPAIAFVSSSGVITGVVPGSTTISYTVSSGGCSASATGTITVTSGASITPGGSSSVCIGGTITYSASPTGGVWSSTPGSVASITSGGVLTGVSAGSAHITYVSPGGCWVVVTDYVSAPPTAITGPGSVCAGSTITLMDAVPGGIWVSTSIAVATVDAATGVVTGIAPGTTTISYVISSGCSASTVVTVTPVATISAGGPMSFCVGGTVTLTGSPSGGTWSAVAGSVSVSSGGVVTGTAAGAGTITYTTSSGCAATTIATVMPNPGAIAGGTSGCVGANTTLMCGTSGGTWSSSNPAVGTINVATGVAACLAAGTTTITYSLPTGCYSTVILTVNSTPSITASATAASCGNTFALAASGATTYVWTPATGLSCVSCSSPTATPSATTTYTVDATLSSTGCTGVATVTVSGDRIYGHVTFSSSAPSSPTVKVWLIQYDPTDSSITATDSVNSCTDGGSEYYHFDGKPAGNYLVKAKLISAIAGTSDYIPTYGASTPNWYSASSVTHAGASDVQDISMIYGTVPSGPGFISGYVYSGAGKGTASDVPVAGRLIFLKNTAGQVLTYTYTTSTGSYTFGSLAYGSYVIYPEEESYYTTPSATIVLNAATPSESSATFKQYLTSGVILPYAVPTSIFALTSATVNAGVYPNPSTGTVYIQTGVEEQGTAQVSLTDLTGRTVRSAVTEINAKGSGVVNVSGVSAGVYILRITSDHFNYTGKLMIQE